MLACQLLGYNFLCSLGLYVTLKEEYKLQNILGVFALY